MAVMLIAVLVALAGGAATVFLLGPAELLGSTGADEGPASAGGSDPADPASGERRDDDDAAHEREAAASNVVAADDPTAGDVAEAEPAADDPTHQAVEEGDPPAETARAAPDTGDPRPEANETATAEPTAGRRRPDRAGGRGQRGRARSGGGGALPEGVGGADAFGFLHLTSSPPGLQVFAGSRSLGRTPLQTRLPVGTHSIRLVDAQGDSHRFPVRIDAYATSVMNVDAQ